MVSGWDSRDGVVASLRFSPLPESFFVLPSLGVLRTHEGREGVVVGEADRSSDRYAFRYLGKAACLSVSITCGFVSRAGP
jgi:hypothetical protein